MQSCVIQFRVGMFVVVRHQVIKTPQPTSINHQFIPKSSVFVPSMSVFIQRGSIVWTGYVEEEMVLIL